MVDTAPIRPEERFDEVAVASYLREQVPDLVDDAEITFAQFPGGAANLTYEARAGSVELVLRRAPLGDLAQSGHDMEREFRVLSRLWREYPKAPRAFHFCSDPDVMGKPFFIMERRHGHVIRTEWPSSLANDLGKRTVAESLVDALAELHRIRPDTLGLGDFGRPRGFVERQVVGWMQRWDAARTRDLPDMRLAADRLLAGIPDPQAAVVLHNDFKLDNTMVDDAGSLVAVFDWDMSTRGDPLVDLGTLLAYWPDPEAPTATVFGEMTVSLAASMNKTEVRRRYAAGTGFDVSGVGYYEGLALYRIAVIIEQIYARYAAGQTSDQRFARFEPLPPLLAAAAVGVLAGLGE